MARILLGVSGGIAAYKALELARLATVAGHGVRVLMTEGATRFVGAASFEGIVGAPVLISEFERDPMRGAYPGDPAPGHDPIGHLEVAANCDAYIVAPASANTIAKLATGIADSMLTTSFLACTAPRLLAPAMNDRMYNDAATQANLATLRERGVTVIDPDEGALASRGEQGKGRLPDPTRLLALVEAELPTGHRPWDGLRVLVTAGGTREPIDTVRYIGNRSSGRMGMALAAAAARRGADVTLIAANVSLPEPPGVHRIDVETGEQLAKAAQSEFPNAHVLLMAAAPADFRAVDVAAGKLTRDASLDLHLEPTEDILANLTASRTDKQTIVAFAAEAGENVKRAEEKLARKKADLIVLNDISNSAIGFESEQNAVTLIDSASTAHVPQASKDTIADAILDRASSLREEGRESPRTGGYSKRRP
ncbi:MAG TPA: bifunctional phosphopantothenoylcysteine decarboxylase/phosphopantothenate--cysteine ligase CoaBC [Solirubrobacterales bacterium]|jgi:phosphopantothenoylcysteine decarboxylase/phosphopantothenate--cysteine ligase|nr:bifunctional phosphopantothenoylcysteine decarboxylase/phosphopantothenate--cysteine ligase CoaBC [Solirubrobacterales bacterium]